MTALLGTQQLVVSADAEGLELVGVVEGPAGSNGIDFDRLEVTIDAANPGSINRIRMPHIDQLSEIERAVIELLLGPARVDRIRALEPDHRRPTILRNDLDEPVEPVTVDRTFAALAVAVATLNRPGLTQLESVLLTLDAARLARNLGLLTYMEWLVTESRTAAELLLDTSSLDHLNLGESGARRLEIVLDFAADLAPALDSEGLARLLASNSASEESAQPSRSLEAGAPAQTFVKFSPDSLPLVVAGVEPMVTRLENDEFEIRLPDWAGRTDGWWVRVFVGDAQPPMALAPLRSEGTDAVAVCLISRTNHEVLTVDVVEDVREQRSAPEIAVFRAALAAGQRAARLERLNFLVQARTAWLKSSSLHEQAGDAFRSSMARAIAENELHGSMASLRHVVDPIITDHTGPVV